MAIVNPSALPLINNPANNVDPDEGVSIVISRPLGAVDGANHAFVATINGRTGETVRFSFGPQGDPVFNPGRLVSLTGTDTGTNDDDDLALQAFLRDPKAAAEQGIIASRINASNASVLTAGNQVTAALGTPNAPAAGAPRYNILPESSITWAPTYLGTPPHRSGTANSNSAAFAVANRALKLENPFAARQPVPLGAFNPGADQHGEIPN